MNLFHYMTRGVCNGLANLAPNAFLDALRRNHYELVAREFNRAYFFDWKGARIPEQPKYFEDLAPLFELSPMSRGIIRQDFDEAGALFSAVRGLQKPPRGVEIGRFNGGSTLLLAVAVGEGGKIISIDVGPQDDRALQDVLERAGVRSRVELVVADANKVECKERLDFVFIDGDHSYEGAKRDHNVWGKRVREGGMIIHHDMANSRRFSTQWNELARLRADILKKQGGELKLVQEVGSLAVFRKQNGSWTEI